MDQDQINGLGNCTRANTEEEKESSSTLLGSALSLKINWKQDRVTGEKHIHIILCAPRSHCRKTVRIQKRN